MSYIDGYVIPVPRANKEAYRLKAVEMAALFREHGAVRVVENWGDDVPHGKQTDFYRAVAATDDEVVVFSWIEWPSQAVRDAGWKHVMSDPRMRSTGAPPFDGKRMILGGFEPILDTSRGQS